MATMTIDIEDSLKAMAEERAAKAGFPRVELFLIHLLIAEIAGTPASLIVDSDAGLETILTSRADGPFVEMDAADFQRIRQSLNAIQSR